MVSVVTFTDLKNRTGLSIYFWKTEAKGGHIEGTTWGVQWRYRNENNNSDIFYWKLTNEICWLDTNWITKFPTSFGSDATEISNMAAGGPFNMAAVGNNKSILWSSQNSLVIFMFGVVERNIGCILNLFQKPQRMICLETPSFGWSFQDGCQLATMSCSIQSYFWDQWLRSSAHRVSTSYPGSEKSLGTGLIKWTL